MSIWTDIPHALNILRNCTNQGLSCKQISDLLNVAFHTDRFTNNSVRAKCKQQGFELPVKLKKKKIPVKVIRVRHINEKTNRAGALYVWNDEADAILLNNLSTMTSSELARLITNTFNIDPPLTKNAVIGRSNRLRKKKLKSKSVKKTKEVNRVLDYTINVIPFKQAIDKPSIIQLEKGMCRWPIGEPEDPDFHFCGKEKTEGSSYCKDHHIRSINRVQPQRLSRLSNNRALRE